MLVIGIGAGDPEHLTLQAVKAIGRVDVFFVLDKGEVKGELVRLRRWMVEEYGRGGCRVVEVRDPERDRGAVGYVGAVEEWRSRRAEVFERFIGEELGEGETGGVLVWGDPGVYDSTLAILEEVLGRGVVAFEYEVVPGISSVSALTARHRTSLTQVGRPVHITTGRRLEAEGVGDVDDVVVMLDARCAFGGVSGFDIYWGAYLGTPDEILVSGAVEEVGERIREVRAEARERKGWIMDTYLLRRREPTE
ncbi:precorrin-6A synthase (deacetylating) [Sphaerisporangium sp. B11E5]|uniref:precorrin-6A synthase (deacetylating) n=1 Tax=Sphaerisporangium sp. B11E5 TaxID=3153563 RepID=UPI00325DADDC